jgi:hypothetical protein
MLGYMAYILWCVSWLPTVAFFLMKRSPEMPIALDTTIRLGCAANMLAFYVGGAVWLCRRGSGETNSRAILIAIIFVYLSPLGPAVLSICRSMMAVESPHEADSILD